MTYDEMITWYRKRRLARLRDAWNCYWSGRHIRTSYTRTEE